MLVSQHSLEVVFDNRPQSFYRVQLRTIRWQEHHLDFEFNAKSLNVVGPVSTMVVEYQDDLFIPAAQGQTFS